MKSIVMDSAKGRKREQIGSFAGLQQTMKGMSQVMGSFWGSFLASQAWSCFTPLYLSALWCAVNAAIIYFQAPGRSRAAVARTAPREKSKTNPPSSGGIGGLATADTKKDR